MRIACMAGATMMTAFALVLLNAAPSFASNAATSAPSPLSIGSMLQLVFGLVIVLVAIGAVAWFLRRFGQIQGGAASAMKVLGGVAVGPRERLVLVEIGETWLVVGVAPGQVKHVHTMDRPAQFNSASTEATNQPNFASWLKQAMKKEQG